MGLPQTGQHMMGVGGHWCRLPGVWSLARMPPQTYLLALECIPCGSRLPVFLSTAGTVLRHRSLNLSRPVVEESHGL